MSTLLTIIDNKTAKRTQINLSTAYPDARFYLSSNVMPSRDVAKFVEDRLVFEPYRRTHAKTLYEAFKLIHGDCDALPSQLKEALQERGAIKTVVSINGVKLQGYKGVSLK